MIVFDSSFTGIGFDEQGGIGEVPTNEFLRSAQRVREGVVITDTTGNWGLISYQNTSFDNNFDLYNYVYPFTQINKPQTKKIEICSADLLVCFSTPIELLEAPGTGLIIMPISLGYKYKYKSVAYDFAQNLFVHCSSKTDADPFFEMDKAIINATGVGTFSRSSVLYGVQIGGTPNDDAFTEDDSLVLKAKTSDATTGDGHLTLYVHYVIVEESWRDGVYCT